MKKMLIIIPSFLHGGTNRSFCNIIDLFDFESHGISVDLLCVKFSMSDPYFKEFNARGVNVLPQNRILALLYGRRASVVSRIIGRVMSVLPESVSKKFERASVKRYSKKYDIVAAMEEGLATRIASHIDAPVKYAWVRCMYDRYQKLNSYVDETQYYDTFAKIVCVSGACKTAFESVYPRYSSKTVCIKNTQNKTEIIKKSLAAESRIQSPADRFCVVSLGRLDVVKQFEKIPEIVSKIKTQGKQVSWYIFGEGGERKNIEDAIDKYGVADNVFLPGAIDNPYPEIRRANLVAITSSSESFCNVVTEAEIIGTRVICTPFPAVYDAMRNRITGVICSLDEFADHIVKMINETSLPADNNKIADETYDEMILDFVKALEKLFCEK